MHITNRKTCVSCRWGEGSHVDRWRPLNAEWDPDGGLAAYASLIILLGWRETHSLFRPPPCSQTATHFWGIDLFLLFFFKDNERQSKIFWQDVASWIFKFCNCQANLRVSGFCVTFCFWILFIVKVPCVWFQHQPWPPNRTLTASELTMFCVLSPSSGAPCALLQCLQQQAVVSLHVCYKMQ